MNHRREAMLSFAGMKRYVPRAHLDGRTGASVHLLVVCVTALQLISAGWWLSARSQSKNPWNEMIGSAYTGNRSYAMLRRLCDEAGGRLMGTPVNEKAMDILTGELHSIGYEARREPFTAPGWIRGNDEVTIIEPVVLSLRTVALGYVDRHEAFEAAVVDAGYGFDKSYNAINAAGNIVLVTQESPHDTIPLLRYEAIDIAARHGAKGILFTNDRKGTLTLEGMSNFEGRPSRLPAYSLTFEEGKRIERLLNGGKSVRVRMKTESRCQEVTTANIVATLPGEVPKKIIVGAHFDSWEMGQGAIDNGIGTAILFDLARLMKEYSPHNHYTVSFVWFNGEELGLWGSKNYVAMHAGENIAAMVNLDMTGTPVGFNAMGTDEFVPLLKELVVRLNGFELAAGVANQPGTNSDHQPFMLKGIPTIDVQAHLDEDMGKYYHEKGDTFDKVRKRYLSDAAAVAGVLVSELANQRTLAYARRSDAQTIALMKAHKIDIPLKKMKEWPFGE
jgi:Iap family predicted aminopeptidase